MAEFDIKITPRSREEISNYKNFFSLKNCDFKQFNGRIVYLNHKHPDRHIYQPFFMVGGIAKSMMYYVSDIEKEIPLMTLQELDYGDPIIFYTQEDVERLKEQKTAKKPTTPTKTI